MSNRAIRWLLLFLGCLAAQATLVPVIGVRGVQPDLVLMALFAFALRFGVLPSIYVGFAVGLCQDLYAPAILGQNALANSLMAAGVGMFNQRVMSLDPPVRMLLLLIAFVAHDAVFGLSEAVKTGGPLVPVALELLVRTIPRALYSVVIAWLLYLWERYRAPLPVS
jgi:rod shape-determining protein MreD